MIIREQEVRNQVRAGTAILIPQLGSAYALLHCEEIVQASSRIAGLSLDPSNYLWNLGAERSHSGNELDYARKVIVNCCAAYGLQAIDCRYGFDDREGFVREAAFGRSLGYRGKYIASAHDLSLTAHVEQVAAANEVFDQAET